MLPSPPSGEEVPPAPTQAAEHLDPSICDPNDHRWRRTRPTRPPPASFSSLTYKANRAPTTLGKGPVRHRVLRSLRSKTKHPAVP